MTAFKMWEAIETKEFFSTTAPDDFSLKLLSELPGYEPPSPSYQVKFF